MNHPIAEHLVSLEAQGKPDLVLHRLHDRKAEVKRAINRVLHFLLPAQNRRATPRSDRRQTRFASIDGKAGRLQTERRLPPHQRLREHRRELSELLQSEKILRGQSEHGVRLF